MKKIAVLLITTVLLSLPGLSQVKNNWKQADRSEFIAECVNAASEGMSVDSAKFYCHCMLDIVEKKYPDVSKVDELTTETMETPEWKNLILACIKVYWSEDERREFLKTCVEQAEKSKGAGRAKSFCDCKLYKVQLMYPKFLQILGITEEVLTSPEWKKMLKDCNEF